ncbi:hypothetical protein SADUNF_Sadunf17G0104900 [Salix dunnii]|uniref:Uncharacterized protein n=1 Tax=Salix dunnii TaxID=1413687 RepID=A0A835J6I8_9ROSI|nr:hypothetical protein SADUNF_Sadunf17G0104900 [Salix dunnii]
MKAFLIACILFATVVFSPLSTCTARELAEKKVIYGPLQPLKSPFKCGKGERYCVGSTPKKPPPKIPVTVETLENGTFWSRNSEMKAFLIAFILLATVVFSPLSTCTARELAEKKGSVGGYGSLDPGKVIFSCVLTNVTVEHLKNGTFWSRSSEVWTTVMAVKSLENGKSLSTGSK